MKTKHTRSFFSIFTPSNVPEEKTLFCVPSPFLFMSFMPVKLYIMVKNDDHQSNTLLLEGGTCSPKESGHYVEVGWLVVKLAASGGVP